MTRGVRGARGQATVELALVLPLILALLLAVLQTALIARDQVLVVHAARAGARAAAVSPSAGIATVAATEAARLDSSRMAVDFRRAGASSVEVTVRYRAPTDVPLIGALVGDVDLQESVTMRVEEP